MLLKDSEHNRLSYKSQAIYTGRLVIKEFAAESPDKLYVEYFQNHVLHHKSRAINLLVIKDLLLRRRIVEFLYDSMDSRIMQPTCFRAYRYLTLMQMLNSAPDMFNLPYRDFIQIGEASFDSFTSYKRDAKSFYRCFLKYCNDLADRENPFQGDVWKLSQFHLSDERNHASICKTLTFGKIKSDRNRYLVKKYIEYCLTNTDLSISSINGRLTTYKILLNFVDKPFDEWTDVDSTVCIEKLKATYSKKQTIASRMIN